MVLMLRAMQNTTFCAIRSGCLRYAPHRVWCRLLINLTDSCASLDCTWGAMAQNAMFCSALLLLVPVAWFVFVGEIESGGSRSARVSAITSTRPYSCGLLVSVLASLSPPRCSLRSSRSISTSHASRATTSPSEKRGTSLRRKRTPCFVETPSFSIF